MNAALSDTERPRRESRSSLGTYCEGATQTGATKAVRLLHNTLPARLRQRGSAAAARDSAKHAAMVGERLCLLNTLQARRGG